jgi:hypothetical protein
MNNKIYYTSYIQACNRLVGKELTGKIDGPVAEISFPDSVTKPTEEEVQAKIIELGTEFDNLQFQRDRKRNYPSLEDVTVALAEGRSTMWDTITAERLDVKSRFPKPT